MATKKTAEEYTAETNASRKDTFVINFRCDTKLAEEDARKFSDTLGKQIAEDTQKLEALRESMQNLAKARPWYKEIPPVQWVILALLVADIIVHVVR